MKKKKRGIRVAILDDNALFCDRPPPLLSPKDALTCVGCYTSVSEAVERIPGDQPSILIVDITEPNAIGVDDVKKLKADHSELAIIILTDAQNSSMSMKFFQAGASGFLLKSSSTLEVFSAIRAAYQVQTTMSNAMPQELVEIIRTVQTDSQVSSEAFSRLSSQEKKVLRYLAKGLFYKEIGDQMEISIHTVHRHIGSIYKKLKVQSRTEAAAKILTHLQSRKS